MIGIFFLGVRNFFGWSEIVWVSGIFWVVGVRLCACVQGPQGCGVGRVSRVMVSRPSRMRD